MAEIEVYSKVHYRNCLRCNEKIPVYVNYKQPIKCNNCWEVENRLDKYLQSENGRKYLLKQLLEIEKDA